MQSDGVTPVQVQEVINGVSQVDGSGNPIMVNKTMPLYDYLIAMLSQPIVLSNLYIAYIAINDADGNFNIAEK